LHGYFYVVFFFYFNLHFVFCVVRVRYAFFSAEHAKFVWVMNDAERFSEIFFKYNLFRFFEIILKYITHFVSFLKL